MPVSVNANGIVGGGYTPSSGVTTVSLESAGLNRIMVVGINTDYRQFINSIQYNGVDMTLGLSQEISNSNVYLYYLINPTEGTYDLVINTSGNYDLHICTCFLNGAKQSSPIGGTANYYKSIVTPPDTVSTNVTVAESTSLILNFLTGEPNDSLGGVLNSQTSIVIYTANQTSALYYTLASSTGSLTQGFTGSYTGKHGVMLLEFKEQPAQLCPSFLANFI